MTARHTDRRCRPAGNRSFRDQDGAGQLDIGDDVGGGAAAVADLDDNSIQA